MEPRPALSLLLYFHPTIITIYNTGAPLAET